MLNIYQLHILGDVPGDPELGGWRSLPKNLFRKSASLPLHTFTMTLEQAIQLISFKIRYLRLHRVLETIAVGLSGNKN